MPDKTVSVFLRPFARYGMTLVIVAASFLLRFALVRGLGLAMPTFITFFPAVMLVALLAGFWPGVLATALFMLGTDYWILPPIGNFAVASISDAVALAFFATMGIFMSLVAEDYRRKQQSIASYKVEQALRKNEVLYRGLFNSMDEGFCIIEMIFDAEGKPADYRFLEVNAAFERQTGLHDAVGKRMRELAPAHEAHWFEIYGKIALTGEPAHFINDAKALNRVYDVHAYRVGEPEQRRVAIVFNDISDYKRAEEELRRSERLAFQRQQLQALAERLQQAREEERKMVARDLHDDIGQILTAIKFDMTWVVRHLPPSDDDVRKRLSGSIELINDGVKSVRKICSGLRPGILDDLGLAAAIEWQANEFTSRTGIPCHVSLPPAALMLDGDRATAIFRIFQECLTNVTRHAEAQAVHTSLYREDEDLMLVVEDDGKGFRESEAGSSLGVLGMKERAAAWGGSVQVSSSPGKGTKVAVRVPVHAANAEREGHEYSDRR